MSTSAVYSGWSNGSNGFRLYMYSWIVSQDIVNNTSYVGSKVWLESSGGYYFSDWTSYHNHTMNGVTVADANIQRSIGVNSQTLVLENYITVAHEADGTKTTGIGATFQNTFTGILYVGVNFTLTTIPRASTPSWTGNFVANSASNYSTVINTNRASTSFTHDITYFFGNASGTIGTNVGASVSWSPPVSLLAQIPNSTAGTGTLRTVTKSGSTVVGTIDRNFTLVADADVVPTISSVNFADTNPTVVANVGAYVQSVSTVRGLLTSSGVQGSSIQSERVTIGGVTVDENVPILQTSSGTIATSVTATDSRGRTVQSNSSINVLAYQVPRINSFSVTRATSGGVPSDSGTYLRLDLNAAVSSLIVSSVQKNAMTIQVRTRPTNGGWTNRNTITPGLSYNTNVLITGGGIYAIASSYEVEITVSDVTGATAARVLTTVPTAAVTLDLNGSNVGIGKYHTQGALDVNGDIYGSTFRGSSVVVSGAISGSSISASSSSITGGAFSWTNTVAGGSSLNGDRNGTTVVYQPTTTISNTGGVNTLQVQSNNPSDAFMSFHIAGRYAAHFGLSANTNDLAYGGWSAGANSYKVHHDGNTRAPFRMMAGSAASTAGNYVSVSFGSTFNVAPRVVISEVATGGNVVVPYIPGNVTSSGFTVGGFTLGGALVATTFNWIAVQMTSSSASG